MELFIQKYGSLVIGGLAVTIVVGGFIVAFEAGVGDIIVNYVSTMI